MKLEKLLKTMVLSSALLIALSAAAGAAEPAALSPEPLPAAAVAAPELDGNCEKATTSPLFQVAFEKNTASFTQTCGSCSSPQCNGANLGQMCWTGGPNGTWGNCNLYTGGYSCRDGNWDCQCHDGPLP